MGHALSLRPPGSLPRTSTYPCLQSSQTQREGLVSDNPRLTLTSHGPVSWWSHPLLSYTNKAHTASQSLTLTPLHQKHQGLPSAQLVPGERQQLGHNSPPHLQPLGPTHFVVHVPWRITAAAADAHTTAPSVSRENPRSNGTSRTQCTKLLLFQSPSALHR